MSMMTPLGRGGYMYRRHRRWPMALAVLLVFLLIAGLVAGGWWWWTNRDDGSGQAAPKPAKVCHTPAVEQPKDIPEPAAVDVNVDNGTEQAGLAIDTADNLALVGFNVVGIGNTEEPVKKGVAVIRYGPNGFAGAIRLASYLPGSTLEPIDQRKGPMVDFWIGPDFNGLATSKQADVDAVTLPTAQPVCHKVRATESSS